MDCCSDGKQRRLTRSRDPTARYRELLNLVKVESLVAHRTDLILWLFHLPSYSACDSCRAFLLCTAHIHYRSLMSTAQSHRLLHQSRPLPLTCLPSSSIHPRTRQCPGVRSTPVRRTQILRW